MKSNLDWKLTTQMMLWPFLVITIICSLTIKDMRAYYISQAEASRMNQVKYYASKIDQIFALHKQSVENYGRFINDIFAKETNNYKESIDQITQFMVDYHDPSSYGYWYSNESKYRNQGIFNSWYGVKNGKLMNFGNFPMKDPSSEENSDNPEFSFYWGARNAGKTIISDVYTDQTIKEKMITISTPIYDNNHALMGVAGVDINLNSLQSLLNSIAINEKGYTLLTSAKGDLFTPNYPYVDDVANIIDKNDSDFHNIYTTIKQANDLIQNFSFRGNDTYFISTNIPSSDWKVITIISDRELYETLHQASLNTIIRFGLLLLGCYLILLWWINRNLCHPLSIMITQTRKTLEGNYNNRIELNRTNSFSTLADNINEMIHKLHHNTELEDNLKRISSLQIVGEMAASISHEIRNPLTTIRGFLQILRNKEEYQADRIYFDTMIEEVTRANNIITEYLSLAQDKFTELTLYDLNTIIRTIYPLVQASANTNNQSILLNLEDIPLIHLDEREIRQLLHNLIRNGLEAMSENQNLTICTYVNGNNVVLSIQDQGSGIDPNLIKQLGTPFFTTKENGTGLGLTVCYNIAKRHNAVIEVESNPQGTTFNIVFPL